MNDLIEDIDVLEDLVVAMHEGASDEKYSALHRAEKLLLKKKDAMREFEMEMEKQFLDFQS